MNRNKCVISLISIVCLLLFAIFLYKFGLIKSNESVSIPSEKTEISMKEAIKIAYKEVEKRTNGSKLVMITSVDEKGKQTSESGMLGKRIIWNLTFTEPNTTQNAEDGNPISYDVHISDGKITGFKSCIFGNHTTIDDSDLTLDSSDAVSIAKNQKGLKPGKDWAIGYHFVLQYFPIDDGTDKLIIQVVGLSPKGNFAHVDIDEKTGKIVDAIEKTYDQSGKAIWTDF